MKAAVQVGDRQLETRELAMPSLDGVGALLRIEACGICGSDVESYRGAIVAAGLGRYPYVPGHEPVGVIEWIDDDEARRSGVTVGDRVAVEPFVPCAVCPRCTSGEYRLCRDRFIYSLTPIDVGPGLWGGFAEFMTLRPGSLVHRVADHVTPQDAVLFNPLGAGFEWAVRAGGATAGDVVLVLGAGQRGLAAVVACREVGVDRIVVTGLERDAAKLELAEELGATHTLRADLVDVPEAVTELTAGAGADVVLDVTAGAPTVVNDALAAVRPGGTVVLAGLKDRAPVPGFVSDDVVLKDVTVRGAFGVSAWSFRQALRVIASGRHPLERLHTHTFGLDRLEDAVRLLGGELDDGGPAPLHITIVPEAQAG